MFVSELKKMNNNLIIFIILNIFVGLSTTTMPSTVTTTSTTTSTTMTTTTKLRTSTTMTTASTKHPINTNMVTVIVFSVIIGTAFVGLVVFSCCLIYTEYCKHEEQHQYHYQTTQQWIQQQQLHRNNQLILVDSATQQQRLQHQWLQEREHRNSPLVSVDPAPIYSILLENRSFNRSLNNRSQIQEDPKDDAPPTYEEVMSEYNLDRGVPIPPGNPQSKKVHFHRGRPAVNAMDQ